jgi:hypothetical protein
MRWAGHAACRGEEDLCIQGFLWGDLRERDRFEDLGIDGKIINFILFIYVHLSQYVEGTMTHASIYC